MISESDKILLRDRLGWSEFEKSKYADKLNATNLSKASGFTLNSFHSLVTIENTYNSISEIGASDERFNSIITEILDNVILDILTDVFVTDSNSHKVKYSSSLVQSCVETGIFDKAIGYCHSIKILELILGSVRSNRLELITKENAGQIQSMIKGTYTKAGELLVNGLVHKCKSQRDLIKSRVYGLNRGIEDATNEW